jgi:hypothetical protein
MVDPEPVQPVERLHVERHLVLADRGKSDLVERLKGGTGEVVDADGGEVDGSVRREVCAVDGQPGTMAISGALAA